MYALDKEKNNRSTPLKHDVVRLCKAHPQGSHATRANRLSIAVLMAHDLDAMGFGVKSVRGLKPKHFSMYNEYMKQQGLATGTRKNRMAVARTLCDWEGRTGIVRDNEYYDIHNENNFTEDKARELDLEKLETIDCPHVKIGLRMQAAFGLRREETIKIVAEQADLGDRLALKGAWCKGGRYREIPIETPRQRALVDELKELTKGRANIPDGLSYKQQKGKYDYQVLKAELPNNHGLRHRHFQAVYKKLTGWECPVRGGLLQKDMTPEQYALDRQARMEISNRAGHSRIDITDIYLGRASGE